MSAKKSLVLKSDSDLRKSFNAIFTHAAESIVERDEVLDAVKLALLSKNHVLIMGPAGVAKSMIANNIFARITGGEYFKVQCTKRMSEEYLVGPLDMKLFRDKGEYRHIVSRTLVTADFAFLDEFLDLPDQAARALLEILNERKFSRGRQCETAKLNTAIAATNFTASNDQLHAVEDRFLFRIAIEQLSKPAAIESMLKLSVKTDSKPAPEFSLQDLKVMQRRVDNVGVPLSVITRLAAFAHAARTAGLPVTDRRVVWAINALRAKAYLDKRYYVNFSDLTSLDNVFAIHGDSKHGQLFAQSVTSTLGSNLKSDDAALEMLSMMRESLTDISSRIVNDTKKSEKKEMVAQLNDFIHALAGENFPHIVNAQVSRLQIEAEQYIKHLQEK